MTSPWWNKPIKINEREIAPVEFLQDVWTTLSDREIASVLSSIGLPATIANVTKKRQFLGLRKTREGIPLIFETGGTRKYNSPPVLKTDNVVVMADVHVPYHDVEWCSQVVHIARSLGITDCIIAGDLFDFTALSSFAKFITVSGDDDDLTEEIESAADFVNVLLGNFDRVVYTLGNHEKRLSHSTGVRVRTELIRAVLGQRLQKRLEIAPYYYSIVKSSVGKWRITHPKNSSVIPLRVAARMADKYQMHIIAGHGHDWGCTTSVSGYYAAACGCCADVDKLDYVQLEDNLRPVMQMGAWILHNCNPILLHPKYGT